MAIENAQKKPRIILIIIGILVVIIIIVVFVMGVQGIFKIISTIAVISIFLTLIFLLAYGFWFMFIKKQRFDPVFVNKQKLIRAGKMNLPKGILEDLYISGDKSHSRVKIGKIIGYNRIQIPTRKNVYTETTDEKGNVVKTIKMKEKKSDYEEAEAEYIFDNEEQDVFIVKRNFLQGVIIDPLVIRVNPAEHTDLIGDVILKGFSLIPISEYLFINSDYLDVRKIDLAISKEAERGIMFENLRDLKTIVDRAIGLDASHKKDIEKKDLVDIPQQQGAAR
jgi:hypothetical protein